MGIDRFLNKVFLKDVFDLLKELPDDSVDMVYGDPDYNVGVKYGIRPIPKLLMNILSGILSWQESL